MSDAVHNSVSQGLLAKLLATENISVHVGSYKTAMFDVRNRVLCLPSWNVDSKKVSDLLVGHEVGHALYTPVEAKDTFKEMCPECPFSILNIVEDVRIERMIQDRYPGLISAFNAGYEYFLKFDRFGLKGRDPNSLGFADRLNLKAKCRSKIDIKFTADEQIIFDRCHTTETIEDVYELCIIIYEMIKNEKRPEKEKPNKPPKTDEDEGPGDEQEDDGPADEPEDEEEVADDTDEDSDGDVTEESDEVEKGEEEEQEQTRKYGDVDDELESDTLNSLNDSLESLHTDFGRSLPVVAPNREVVMSRVTLVREVMDSRMERLDYRETFLDNPAIFHDWIAFKRETLKNIQFLITEFERKKSAYQYSRAKVSDTGDIDVDRLHSYKYDDHIFKTVTKLADAKSHGMMFFIDYSGSMIYSIHDVINHTLNLVMFCKAVGIPFQVFGFTTPRKNEEDVKTERRQVPLNHLVMLKTNIFELLNSEMKSRDYELGCRHLRAQAFTKAFLKHPTTQFTSEWEYMIATPLNETLVAAHTLVKNFRKKHAVQKMNVMILSDGAPNKMTYGLDGTNATNLTKSKTTLAQTRFQMNLNGREVLLSACELHNYCLLIENLRVTCDCTVVGFFINPNDSELLASAISSLRYSRENGWTDKEPGPWVKASHRIDTEGKALGRDRVLAIDEGYNYNGYILINSNSVGISEETDFVSSVNPQDINSTAAQNKITNEFKKFTKARKTSRIILSEFAKLIS